MSRLYQRFFQIWFVLLSSSFDNSSILISTWILFNSFYPYLSWTLLIHVVHFLSPFCLSLSFFPECVAKGSRFTLRIWGWRRVRSTPLLGPQPSATAGSRRQPSATVSNRSRWWGRCGRAYGEFCKNVHFWKFQSSRSLVSSGRRGTLWHSHMFHNVSKIVLRDMAQYFRVVFRRWGAFFGAGTALWRTPSSFCVAGVAVQTCCLACFFCESQCQGCAKWWQRANSVAGVAFCDMW